MSSSTKKKKKRSTKKKSSKKGGGWYSDVEGGIHLMWDNKFDEAESFFEKHKDKKPRHALYYAEIPVLRSFITGNTNDRECGIERLNKTIELVNDHLKMYEKEKIPFETTTELTKADMAVFHLDAKVVLGDAHTMLAALHVVSDSKLKGALLVRKGWKIYEAALKDLEESNEREYDPKVVASLKFGAGLFMVLIALIPPGVAKKLATLAGFKANKELGLRYLQECYESNSTRSHFASIVISLNHMVLSPILYSAESKIIVQDCEKMLQNGLSKYPNGALFQAIYSLCSIERGKPDQAVKSLETAILNSQHLTEVPPIFYRVLSNCYALQFNWERTAEVLETLLENDENVKEGQVMDPWSLIWHQTKLAAAYMMLGKSEEAMKLFKKCGESNGSGKWEIAIAKLARKYHRTGGHFSMLELLILTGQFEKLVNCGQKAQKELLLLLEKLSKDATGACEVDLKKKLDAPKKGMLSFVTFGLYGAAEDNAVELDNRVCYLLVKGAIMRSLDKQEEAISMLQEIEGFKNHLVDKLYYVLSQIELGKCFVKSDKKKAVAHLKEAMKISGFPWEDGIKYRTRVYMGALGHHEDEEFNTDGDKEEEEEEED